MGAASDGSCEPCAKGTMRSAESASATCTACSSALSDPHLTTFETGATSDSDCVCDANYYKDDLHTPSCIYCQPGANCTVEGLTLRTLPLRPGYWRWGAGSRKIFVCPEASACPGGAPSDETERAPCAAGHAGVMCEVCVAGYFRPEGSGSCELCDGTQRWTYVWFTVVIFCMLPLLLIVGCVVGHCRGHRICHDSLSEDSMKMPLRQQPEGESGKAPDPRKSVFRKSVRIVGKTINASAQTAQRTAGWTVQFAKMCRQQRGMRWEVKSRSLVVLLQIVSLLSGGSNIRWPANYSQLTATVGSLANLNPVAWIAPSCIDPAYDWHATLLQATMLPLALIFVLVLVRGIVRCLGHDKRALAKWTPWRAPKPGGNGSKRQPRVARACETLVTGFLLVWFPKTVADIFSAYSCFDVDVGIDAGSGGSAGAHASGSGSAGGGPQVMRFLNADLSINCDSARHQWYMGYAGFMIFCYPVLVPLALLLVFQFSYKDVTIAEKKAVREALIVATFDEYMEMLPKGLSGATPTHFSHKQLRDVLSHYGMHRSVCEDAERLAKYDDGDDEEGEQGTIDRKKFADIVRDIEETEEKKAEEQRGADKEARDEYQVRQPVEKFNRITMSDDYYKKLSREYKRLFFYGWLKPVLDGYKAKWFMFELLECVRKVALAGMLLFEGEAALLYGILVSSVLLCIFCAARPHQLWTDNVAAGACQGAIVVTLLLALYLQLVRVEAERDMDDALTRGMTHEASLVHARLMEEEGVIDVLLIVLTILPIMLALSLMVYESLKAARAVKVSKTKRQSSWILDILEKRTSMSWVSQILGKRRSDAWHSQTSLSQIKPSVTEASAADGGPAAGRPSQAAGRPSQAAGRPSQSILRRAATGVKSIGGPRRVQIGPSPEEHRRVACCSFSSATSPGAVELASCEVKGDEL